MGQQLVVVGTQHGQLVTGQIDLHIRLVLWSIVADLHHQGFLAAGQVDVHIGQQLRVQQRAVQGTARIVNAQSVAQRVQAVAFAGVHLLGHDQGIDHIGHMGGERCLPCLLYTSDAADE